MKKAKVILTALTVLAVVGGALAFKAKTQTIWCGVPGSVAGSSQCPAFLQKDYTFTAPSNIACTKVFNQLCVDPTVQTIFHP